MRVTHISVSNWRNFKALDFPVGDRLFVVGPNAAGKSNFLDVFRFLSDVASPGGGGLSAAVDTRGGLSKIRSLFARNNRGGRLIIDLQLQDDGESWGYRLSVKGEGKGKNRPVVDEEVVRHNGHEILRRPDDKDLADAELLTQTHLEQITQNYSFRQISEYLAKVEYFHLVPQVIRDSSRAGAPGDPFGGDFIAQINAIATRTRTAWLKRMQSALSSAVPEFESLDIEVDTAGRPHLVAGYRNWRASPTHHNETQFSDGTLRLIGLLWTVVSTPANGGILLLEEPELSLNSAIVRTLPSVLSQAQRRRDMQVLLSTHAPELLDDEGVLPREVLVLRVTSDGTVASLLSEIAEVARDLEAGLPTSETVESLIAPSDLRGLVAVGNPRR